MKNIWFTFGIFCSPRENFSFFLSEKKKIVKKICSPLFYYEKEMNFLKKIVFGLLILLLRTLFFKQLCDFFCWNNDGSVKKKKKKSQMTSICCRPSCAFQIFISKQGFEGVNNSYIKFCVKNENKRWKWNFYSSVIISLDLSRNAVVEFVPITVVVVVSLTVDSLFLYGSVGWQYSLKQILFQFIIMKKMTCI